MKTFLPALALTLLACAADATSLKAHYGHYYATRYADNTTTDIATLCGKRGIQGINYRVRWGDVEPSDGSWVDTTFDAVLSKIATLGVPLNGAPNNTCKLWLFVETKLFAGSNAPVNFQGDHQPCPVWLTASDGSLGYSPNTDSTSTVTLAAGASSATNATPIHIITSSGQSTWKTGDVVFVDNVQGNTAANGRWVITKNTATDYTLQGSNGNGARTGALGKITNGVVYTCKMWNSTVITKFKALIDHLATKYDGNANVEGLQFEESALGLNNAYAQDSSTNGGSSAYTGTLWTSAMIQYMQRCGSQFAASRCMYFLNFIQGNQAGLHAVSDAIHAMADNQGCYSGPDILPASAQLYNGLNQTYQVLIKHVGCRANSAQDTTIVGSAQGPAACDPTNCNSIFQFAVQGTFGSLGLSNPLPPGDGLCINSYIFWNDSVPEQAKVDPTVQAFPYGSQWYGQCKCGGNAP